MKRFQWPLQRLLDVTIQREKAQQAELLAVTRQIAATSQKLMLHRADIRMLLAELAGLSLADRMARHGQYMAGVAVHEGQIARREAELTALAADRDAKSRLLIQMRKKRENLERLRSDAWREHSREVQKAEQLQFDDNAHVGKARELIRARAAGIDRESTK